MKSKTPITLSMYYKNKPHSKLQPNEQTIGINMRRKIINFTEKYGKRFKTTISSRKPFQRRETSINYVTLSTVANYPFIVSKPITQVSGTNTERTIPNNWTNYNHSMPSLSTENIDYRGYTYTTNVAEPYTGFSPPLTESPRDFTYPPYYPPYDTGNGYQMPPYGYTETTTSNPPSYGFQPSPNHPPYGADYTYHPPSHHGYDNHHEEHWYVDRPHDNEHYDDDQSYDLNGESQSLEDGRENAVSNLLGSDAYELILTALAFLAFGTYFMNMMMKIMETNSGSATMIVGNGANNLVPSYEDNVRTFSDDDSLQAVQHVLLSIQELYKLFEQN